MKGVGVPVWVFWVCFAGFGGDADTYKFCWPLLAYSKPCSWQTAVEMCFSGSLSFAGWGPEAGFPCLHLWLDNPFSMPGGWGEPSVLNVLYVGPCVDGRFKLWMNCLLVTCVGTESFEPYPQFEKSWEVWLCITYLCYLLSQLFVGSGQCRQRKLLWSVQMTL